MAFFYSIPNPHPPRGPTKPAALTLTRASQLCAETLETLGHLSPAAGSAGRFRPHPPVAWLDMHDGTWTLADCPPAAQAELVRALGISEVTASVLVRRGYSDPAVAQHFLDGEQPPHDPFLLGDMDAACTQLRAAVEAGRRICVHGDYDVDGIAATTLALLLLRELGADVTWHLPSRFDEGYGVRRETIARLADEGCGLVLTVDCGITAAVEVAEAKERGLDVVVTDHHRPGETLPDCPIVATRPSEYPFPELCGTGVVYKLGQALFGVDSEIPRRHLDLVALATIADVVPLVDENRSLAIAGLRALARTAKPGLRALMQSAGVDPATVDAGAVGFRLAPRLNAAGRLGHPREALELLLTDDETEARRLADSLEELNRERQSVESRILREAVAQVESWPAEWRGRRAYAVAGADWHEGVIGIVASRLVERYHRPVVLIAGTEGDWKGSGRSVPAFDLHGALGACADLLGRWGGHRAAAGLSVREENVEAFAEAFANHAASVLDEEDLEPPTPVDAVVARGADLSLSLSAELGRLAPFGLGNPAPTLLAPGCGLAELATVGEGKHLRFRVRRDGRDAGSAIAFGQGSRLEVLRPDAIYDVAFRLEENHWNGTVVPQLVVRRVFPSTPGFDELREWLVAEYRKPSQARDSEAQAILVELGLDVENGLGSRRHLLESARFRALLAAAPRLARAA
jgi:single-stranded-DNA-specific exonuclease